MILRTTSISRLASTFVFRTPVNYMDISVLDLFKFNAGADTTKQLDRRNSMEPSEVCHPYMWDLTCFRLSLSSQQHPDQFLHDSPQLAAPAHAPLARSPPQQFAPGIPVSTTAQDLLNNVLGLSRTAGDGSEAFSSLAPQASMLSGSAAPTKSIWTDSSLGSTAAKHTLLPQQTPNKSYIRQER